jgi:hypothetical protein
LLRHRWCWRLWPEDAGELSNIADGEPRLMNLLSSGHGQSCFGTGAGGGGGDAGEGGDAGGGASFFFGLVFFSA